MPACLDNGARVLNVLRFRVPQKRFYGPANDRYVTLAVGHVRIPYDLRNGCTRAVEVFRSAPVNLGVVIDVVNDVSERVLQVHGLLREVWRLRHNARLGQVLHLVGNMVVERTLERMKLQGLFFCVRRVLLRIAQPQNLADYARLVVVRPARMLEYLESRIYLFNQLHLLLAKRLFACNDADGLVAYNSQSSSLLYGSYTLGFGFFALLVASGCAMRKYFVSS